MKKIFTSTMKKLSVAALACASITFNASAEKLFGHTATEIVGMMTTGWNLGNTFDATGKGNSLDAEISWGQPRTTQEMISAVHAAGFNTIRIPVSWGNHTTGDEYDIDEAWMNRVKEVVDYAYNEDMFVIINIHHDNNNYYYMPEDDDVYREYIMFVWRQIAEAFKDYDQHLIFEILNEPRLVGNKDEWWFDINNPSPSVKEALDMINEFNQIGVDETRNNGTAENLDRVIMCPGYAACWEGCMSPDFKLPDDKTADRLALSLHAYRPYDLCLGSKSVWLDSYEEEIEEYFSSVYKKFVVGLNTPVVIGEESCSYRSEKREADRLKWVEVYYSTIKKYGMPGILWDNNVPKNNGGETHGHFDRVNLTWYHPDFINKIMEVISDVENISVDNSLAVSPNPATDMIVVSSDNELQSIEIYSMDGVKVFGKQLSGNRSEVNVAMLNRGVYNVVLRTDYGVNIGKIILK